MRTNRTLSARAALGALLGAVALCAAAAPQPARGVVEVGDSPTYAFRSPLVNGMGRTSLEELRGAPVLVEFWGTR